MSEKQMMVELMFPSKYLRAGDFLGKDVTKTIESVESDELRTQGKGKVKKFVIHFSDTEKMLVLNKTNAFKIAEVLGIRDALKWVGHKITLYPTTCEAFGEIKDCIRVKGGE